MNKKPSLLEELFITFRRIYRNFDLHSQILKRRYGLTNIQYVILNELEKRDRITIGVLARTVKLSQATITGILDRLETKAYVSRIRSNEDKRKVFLVLTERGRKLHQEASVLFLETPIHQFNQLADWEQMQIVSAFQRIASMTEFQPDLRPPEGNSINNVSESPSQSTYASPQFPT